MAAPFIAWAPVQKGASAANRISSRAASFIAAFLLAVFVLLLIGSVRQESQTFDEANHLYAGLQYWKHWDFGHNPEHPPFAKLVAALPVLPMHLREPAPVRIPFFKAVDNVEASELLYSGDAERVLFRGRMMIVGFSVVLALLVFLAARRMFGDVAAVLALTLLVFQPVVLANGGLITTDMPVACTFFAAVFCFYLWSARPSIGTLVLCAVCTVLTLVSKHSGVLLLPVLGLLALIDGLRRRRSRDTADAGPGPGKVLLMLAGLAAVAYLGIWAFYGLRYAARPGGNQILPNLASYSAALPPAQLRVIRTLSHLHLLPEAYLFGWTDILLIPGHRPSFLFGRVFSSGPWFFLPAVFLIKTTVTLLVLLLLVPLAHLGRQRRELVYMVIPAAVLLLTGVLSGVNLGVRHLLPMYPFCAVLAGAAAAAFAQRSAGAQIAVAVGMVLTIASSLFAYPDYLAYSNEIFGGPSRTVHLTADANGDWGQGLRWTKDYLDRNHSAGPCWLSYMHPAVPVEHFGIHCRPLLSGMAHAMGVPVPPIPSRVSGVFLISNTDLSGPYWGPREMNPYAVFRDRKPDTQIENAISVYHGSFDVPLLAAQSNLVLVRAMLSRGQVQGALPLARAAVAQAPACAEAQALLARMLLASGQPSEAGQHFTIATHLAQTIAPEYQKLFLPQLVNGPGSGHH